MTYIHSSPIIHLSPIRIQAEMSRRLHWKENLDRLPEVMEEERRIEKEKILERYNRLNSE